MLDGEDFSRFSEVEHVEDNGFAATVLATMDSANHLYKRFSLMEGMYIAVLADDG